MSVCVCLWCLQRPEEGVGSLEAGVWSYKYL